VSLSRLDPSRKAWPTQLVRGARRDDRAGVMFSSREYIDQNLLLVKEKNNHKNFLTF
jgi:hypothetical protein